ncbi:MAG: ATP-dependent protease subunit HslV [Desulfobacterales bacterium]|jgi:ATP-dependent HslUV protease subunit HslV
MTLTPTDRFHGTTILAVRRNGKLALAGDGQVTLNNTVIKHRARKVRRIFNERILVGFAGATADALTLSEKLEAKLERYNGNLTRSAVELARDWRADKYLRRLEALMIAADDSGLFLLSGTGDVIEPDRDIAAIGSGAVAAQSAAWALFDETEMTAAAIVRKAMEIAAATCVFTNSEIHVEEL